MSENELSEEITAAIDAELAKTDEGMTLNVEMEISAEGVKLHFTRTPKEESE